MMNQKNAVFAAVSTVVEVKDGVAVELSKDQKNTVVEILVQGFENGEIALDSKQKNLKIYTVGLLNNWLRRDTRLNGGVKAEVKNPGSRSQDPVIKNLRALLGQTTDPQTKAMIQLEIDQLQVAKQVKAKPAVDLSMIPQDIRIKLGLE